MPWIKAIDENEAMAAHMDLYLSVMFGGPGMQRIDDQTDLWRMK